MLAQLPQLEGVDFRMFRDSSDYPHFARIITAFSEGEGNDRVETAESIAAGYDHLERCDPKRDLLVAELDGRPVAYARVSWDDEVGGPRIYRQVCFVDPEHGARGIGSALFAWSDARLREIAAEHDAPEKTFEVYINDRNPGGTAIFRGAGFEPVTYSAEMVRPSVEDLAEHALPDGVEIRPVRTTSCARSGRPTSRRSATTGASSSRPRSSTTGSSPSRTTTRRCGRSRGTTKASRGRSARTSTRRRTRRRASSAGGPSSSPPRAAGAAAASRRPSSWRASASSARAG